VWIGELGSIIPHYQPKITTLISLHKTFVVHLDLVERGRIETITSPASGIPYCERRCFNKYFMNILCLQVEGHAEACEETCRSMCREQGIGYVRLSPSLGSEVDSGETDDEKLMDMMWTTRKYMANSGHRHLNILRDLIVIP
jgi:hypothetical protein